MMKVPLVRCLEQPTSWWAGGAPCVLLWVEGADRLPLVSFLSTLTPLTCSFQIPSPRALGFNMQRVMGHRHLDHSSDSPKEVKMEAVGD